MSSTKQTNKIAADMQQLRHVSRLEAMSGIMDEAYELLHFADNYATDALQLAQHGTPLSLRNAAPVLQRAAGLTATASGRLMALSKAIKTIALARERLAKRLTKHGRAPEWRPGR